MPRSKQFVLKRCFDLQVNLHVMKTFLSENQRWPFSRFSFFITLEVGDALVLTKRIAGNEIILTQCRTQSPLAEFLSAALTKKPED